MLCRYLPCSPQNFTHYKGFPFYLLSMNLWISMGKKLLILDFSMLQLTQVYDFMIYVGWPFCSSCCHWKFLTFWPKMFQTHPELPPSPEICHFYKEDGIQYLVETDIKNPRSNHQVWNIFASRSFQQTELGNEYTNICLYKHLSISNLYPWVHTDASNTNSIPEGSS